MIAVYLCGGINKLPDSDAIDWREAAKSMLVGFAHLDPMRRDYRGKESDSVTEIVVGDLADITESSIVLANVSRPSWGTAMEVYHAFVRGKTVVAFGAGDRPSPWLVFHTHRLVTTLEEAVAAVRDAAKELG